MPFDVVPGDVESANQCKLPSIDDTNAQMKAAKLSRPGETEVGTEAKLNSMN